MNLPIVLWVALPLVAVQVLLRLRRAGTLLWTLTTWLEILIFLRFGFAVPVPQSVVTLYMGIVTLATIAYVTSSRERLEAFTAPLVRLCLQPERRTALYSVVALLPLLVAFGVYRKLNVRLEAPAFGRTIHPAPPDSVTVHGKPYDLVHLDSPFHALKSTDPEAYRQHVANGRRVYYQNCVFCHGDALRGDGMYVRGLNPIPTNFADGGAIALLQESFLFWRISKDEIWDVIHFLYDFTGQQPRAREEHK